MMGFPPTSSPNAHLYPQALQLKLYQAFIFSIPILFSIILFLLFYLFYLKRRATSLSSPSQVLPTSSNQAAQQLPSVCQIGLKKEIKDKLPIVLFDEDLKTRESQCCVCLGEFEMKEELLQIPSCKHVFHIECIHHWLHSNTTCPLCRSFVIIPTTKLDNQDQSGGPDTSPPPYNQDHANSNHHIQIASLEQQQQQQRQQEFINTQIIEQQQQQLLLPIQESSSRAEGACPMNSVAAADSCPVLSISVENERGSSSQESVAIHIQIQ
eukprot:XP_002518854.2 probable E3 ubiquitin-protein ligase RHA4A [Ricinus communis]